MTANADAEKLQDMLHALTTEKERPAETQRCPICGGQLHVYFGAYKRDKRDMFGVVAECDECGIAMAIDYGEPLPHWLRKDDIGNA